MPDWRNEVCDTLSFWIGQLGGGGKPERPVPIGRARPESDRGWYAVDVRGSRPPDIDQVESLRLCGKDGPTSGVAHPVLELLQEGSLVRLRVAGFVDLADAYLWQLKQPPTYLLEKLRDGIAGMADAGLAHDLAAGRLAAAPAVVSGIAGFTPMQNEAYESCFTPGVRLVWGPPGTGKTRVLTEAIGTLIAADKRVLLVSATNIAVDNALLGVIARRRHRPGQLLRVGPPHHPEVAKHPDVCLPDLVRDQLADVERQRRAIEQRLLAMRDADDELERIEQLTAGFDPKAYTLAVRLKAVEASIPALEAALADREETSRASRSTAEELQQQLAAAADRVTHLEPTRTAYAGIDQIRQQLQKEIAAVDEQSARALTDRHTASQVHDEVQRLTAGKTFIGLRDRSKIRRLQHQLDQATQTAAESENRARAARELLTRRREALSVQAEQLSTVLRCSRDELSAADQIRADAARAHAAAQAASRDAQAQLDAGRTALAQARAVPPLTTKQHALIEDADRRELPRLVALRHALKAESTAGKAERSHLEKQHASLQDRFDRLRKDAEGDIIGRARLVATTLARLRITPALMKGPYDVVLIDEVGAATLPEVLLAVSRAGRTAVLLGDFMQLNAIIDRSVKDADRPDVRRWLLKDVFAHCGITSAADAAQERGCTALDIQHRFGPEIMALANAIAYDGLLKAGPTIRAHAPNDPEIVVINVDGLHELAKVHATGATKGWWPAGALLSRVLVDYHQTLGEAVGIVTPYGHQVDATLEALRDREPAGGHITEVGTAHSFQGREFPIVIFDLVEDEHLRRWMARASRTAGTWEREGLRLFNVAVTRTQTRLYLLGSRRQIDTAPATSPLGIVAELLRAKRAREVAAGELLSPTASTSSAIGPFGKELAELLAEHVRVSDVNDERTFYETFAEHLASARRTLWIWAPWTARRVVSLLPILSDAVARGVRVTLFVRDPSDSLQGKRELQQYLDQVRLIVPTVIEVNEMHQKIVVIDDKTVLLGSLNSLSQSRTREIMLTMHGEHFARKVLQHEHAEAFATPPACAVCHGHQVDLRRRAKAGAWDWRCYSSTCPKSTAGGRRNWTQPVNLTPRRRT